MQVALTIAGSDSGGAAGVQADLRTFAVHGVHGASAITAITAQNSVGVRAWSAVDVALVVAQIEAVATDLPVAATKTGMLATAAIIRAVAGAASRLALGPLVVDPVMVAKSGDRLLDPEAERAYVDHLFPWAALVTPNLFEAEALTGRRVRTVEEMREAAGAIARLGARAVLVKGGVLAGAAVDVLFDGEGLAEVPGERVATRNDHGAGCTLSAAICARLARGAPLAEAVRGAKAWLAEGLRRSYSVGHGRGPVNHLHALAPAP